MKKIGKYAVVILIATCLLILWGARALATSPMISSIPNQTIQVSSKTDVLSFTVSDNENAPSDLALTYRSSNRSLVPADDDHIILGGYGTNRTVRVIPVPGVYGTSRITITVTDLDGDTNTELFDVEVPKPIES